MKNSDKHILPIFKNSNKVDISKKVAECKVDEPTKERDRNLLKQTKLPTKDSAKIFVFENIQIRVFEIDGEPMFLAMDIAKALDYAHTERMTTRLDSDEIQTHQISGFGNRGVTLINESGLYSAILGSTKPEAKIFKKWVTKEVLPSIRKTGSYSLQPKIPQTYAEALLEAGRLALELEKSQAKIEADKPKVEFYEMLSANSQSLSVGDFAKLLSKQGFEIGQNRLFEWLRESGYIDNRNIPYQQFIKRGLFEVIEENFEQSYRLRLYLKTLITGKGQIYFAKLLRKGKK